jgi:hypothetical protein
MKRLALALSLFAATPALAEPVVATQAPPLRLPLTISLDADTQWHLDRSYRLFGTGRTDTAGGVSATLQVRRVAGAMLEVGAGLHGRESGRAVWGGVNQAELSELTPSLSALLRWPMHRWVEPHVRLTADVTHASLDLTMGNGLKLGDDVWVAGGSAGAGLRLRTSALSTGLAGGKLGIAFALAVEGGFHVGAPYSFNVAPPKPADDKIANDRIPATATSIGNFGRSQPYLRLSLSLLI